MRSTLQTYRDLKRTYEDAITGKLYELGDASQCSAAVARKLGELGVQGYRLNCCTDPVAAYLAREFPNLHIYVYPDHTCFMDQDGVRVAVDNPEHITRFVIEFDSGLYSELDIERAPIHLVPALPHTD